jgi:hypothetical protein
MELLAILIVGAIWASAQPQGQRHKVLLSLGMSLALFAVIVLSLAAGVGLGYVIIFGILYMFDRSRQAIKAAPARVLSASTGSD